MAPSQPAMIGFSGSRARFQSLDDFQKEQDEQDESQAQIDQENLNVQLAKSRSGSPPTKKTRKTPDITAILLETQALEELGETNWVGKLLEYHQANAIIPAAEYTEVQVSESRFNYSITIKQSSEPITSLASFTRKKDAKQFISKLAIDWLISQNLMSSTGDVKFPKTPLAPITPQQKIHHTPISPLPPISSTISPRARTPTPSSSSFPALIPDLCHALGFNIPSYKIVATQEGIPIYHGYADFGSDPRILGPVGEFRDIYGKKRAKEVCAKEVWSFLKDIERQRLEGIKELELGKRKREVMARDQGLGLSGGGVVAGI